MKEREFEGRIFGGDSVSVSGFLVVLRLVKSMSYKTEAFGGDFRFWI